MRGRSVLIALLGLSALRCADRPALPPSQATVTPDSAPPDSAPFETYGAFAFVDSSRTRLLALRKIADPARVKVAICAQARVVPVSFDRHQESTQNDTHRQVAANFDRQAGDVFRMGGRADDDESCFLATETLLAAGRVVALQSRGTPECTASARTRIADARSRAVVQCWELATAGAERPIMLVQFESRGDSALASVAVDVGRLAFLDFPAAIQTWGDIWRVDDGGELSPDSFRILFYLEGPGVQAVAVDWAGAEGASLTLALARASGDFKEVVNDYRYWSPQ